MNLTADENALADIIVKKLMRRYDADRFLPIDISNLRELSSVVFLLGHSRLFNGKDDGACLILNKRSRNVRQAGDLCCPGGGISERLDTFLSGLANWPFFPLTHWEYWPRFRSADPLAARRLALLFATGLREGLEEMRLNPLGVRFLGPLPPQKLVSFSRTIFPFAAWVRNQKRYKPNREVEKVVHIPLKDLLAPGNYAKYRLIFSPEIQKRMNREANDFPCFILKREDGEELLWGATFRIVMSFLNIVFGFVPPPLEPLRTVNGHLKKDYLQGPVPENTTAGNGRIPHLFSRSTHPT